VRPLVLGTLVLCEEIPATLLQGTFEGQRFATERPLRANNNS